MSQVLVLPASLPKRLAAALYDALLILALWFVLGFAALIVTGGEAVPRGNLVFSSLIYAVTAAFFIGFWSKGGQTLGMRAWRLQLRREDGGPLTPAVAALRLVCAIPSWLLLGLGMWNILVDSRRRSWHDRLSRTEVVYIPAPPKT
jgi:uncharacterized RDD family membrane protein YckC